MRTVVDSALEKRGLGIAGVGSCWADTAGTASIMTVVHPMTDRQSGPPEREEVPSS